MLHGASCLAAVVLFHVGLVSSQRLIIKARKVNTDIIRMGKKPLQLDLTSDGWHFKGTLNRMTVGSEKVGGIMTAEKAGITGQEQDFGSGRVFVVTKTQEGLRDTDKGIFANFRIGDKDSAAPAEGTVQLQNGVKEVLIKALVKTIDDQYKVATAAESVGDI